MSYLSFTILVILFIVLLLIIIGWRWMMKMLVNKMAKIIFTDSYLENLIEMIPGFRHMGIQNVLENSLRAEAGGFASSTSWIVKEMASP